MYIKEIEILGVDISLEALEIAIENINKQNKTYEYKKYNSTNHHNRGKHAHKYLPFCLCERILKVFGRIG